MNSTRNDNCKFHDSNTFPTRQGADGEEHKFEVVPNQYVVLHDSVDESHTGLARLLADTGYLIPVTGPRKPVFGIMARNLQADDGA